jgi:hypothetical protein
MSSRRAIRPCHSPRFLDCLLASVKSGPFTYILPSFLCRDNFKVRIIFLYRFLTHYPTPQLPTQLPFEGFDKPLDWKTPDSMPTLDQLPYVFPDRHPTTKHVKKSRKVHFSRSRTSPIQTTSIPINQSHDVALAMAQNNPISREDGLFTEAAEFTSYSKAPFDYPIQDEHSQPSSQQSSTVPSRSNSGNSLWSGQSSQSSDDFSVIHSLDFMTPDSTFSESDGSFHGSSCSSLDLVLLEADCGAISRSRASGIPQARRRPRLQVETSFQCIDGEFGDICYSPVDSDPRSEFDYPPTDIALPRDHNGALQRAELQVSGPSHLYAASIDQTIPHCLSYPEAGQASVFGSSVPPFGYGCSEQRSSPLCSCHKLLKRPFFPLPEPDSIFRACDSYSRRIRQTPQTIVERLQLKFEVMWKNIHDTIKTLPARMQHILYQTFNTPPTLQNALETLKLLCEKRPPTPQGYLSLAFFAQAWLSLEEKHDVSEVTNALFAETTRCITLITSQDIREAHGLQSKREAYDVVLQLLWRPRVLTTASLESHGLFCPMPTLSTIYSANDSFRTKTASSVGPKWVLCRLCRGMVDGKLKPPFETCG